MESQYHPDETLQADLRQYIALLLRWAWLIILAAILAGGAAYVTSQFQDPVYQATTTLLINEATTAQTSDYTAILTSERLARTYSEMLTKRPVLDEVLLRMEALGLILEYDDIEVFKETITVQLVRDTQLIDLSVEDTDPERAALIANTLVEVFTEQNQALQATRFAESKANLEEQLTRLDGQIHNVVAAVEDLGDSEAENERNRLETELTQYRQTYSELLQSYEQIRVAEAQATSNVVQVEPAIATENPIRPRVLMNTALALVVGGMLAVGAIFLLEALDDTIKSPDDVSRQMNLPILGTILRHEANNGDPVTIDAPRSPTAEAFRSLRTNIQYTSVDKPIRSLLITSPTTGAGKSTIAANLGVAIAQGGKRAIIVDADMRRPVQHKHHKLPNRLGLSSLIVYPDSFNSERDLPEGFVQPSKAEGLAVITSGKIPPNPSELLASEKMNNLLSCLKVERDMVIVDSPPMMAVTDAAVLSPRVDGVLLVIKPGETKLDAARQTVEQLHRVGANLIGVVINEVDPKSSRYGYYYRYDEQYYGHEVEKSTVGRKALWGGAAVATLLFLSWLGLGLITGRGLPVWMGGAGSPTPASTQISVAQALTQAAPTADVTATSTPPAAQSAANPTTQSGTAQTQAPTSTPRITSTPLPPTPGPGLGTPFGAQGEYLLHQVKFGDNLPKLAEQYQTDQDVIVAANGLLSDVSLQPDQVIVIMPGRTDSIGVEHLSVLFLDEDIAMSKFASRYGVTISEVRSYNDLGAHEVIPAGRWLIFPKRNITLTPTPTTIPTPDLSYALTEPFGPNDAYILHRVTAGESVPALEYLYLASAEVIYAANEIEGSIQVGDVLVILLERRDASGIAQFTVMYVTEEISVEDMADQLEILTTELLFHNDLESGDLIPVGSWLIYPTPLEE